MTSDAVGHNADLGTAPAGGGAGGTASALVVEAVGGEFVEGTVVSVLQAAAGAVEQAGDDGAGLPKR